MPRNLSKIKSDAERVLASYEKTAVSGHPTERLSLQYKIYALSELLKVLRLCANNQSLSRNQVDALRQRCQDNLTLIKVMGFSESDIRLSDVGQLYIELEKQVVISEIKAKIESLLIEYKAAPRANQLTHQVIHAYNIQALTQLLDVLNECEAKKSKESALAQALEHCLKANWDLIKGTGLSYTCLNQSDVTRLYVKAAKFVAYIKNKSVSKYNRAIAELNQKITKENNEIIKQNENSHWRNKKPIKPYEDYTRPISIVQVLMPSVLSVAHMDDEALHLGPVEKGDGSGITAEVDVNALLGTHILSDNTHYLLPARTMAALDSDFDLAKQKLLNPYYDYEDADKAAAHVKQSEYHRLVAHSDKTRDIHDNFIQLRDLMKDSNSLLGQLNLLTSKMLANSVHGIGSEEHEGGGGIHAIAAFYEYYKNLVREGGIKLPESLRALEKEIDNLRILLGILKKVKNKETGQMEWEEPLVGTDRCLALRRAALLKAMKGQRGILADISLSKEKRQSLITHAEAQLKKAKQALLNPSESTHASGQDSLPITFDLATKLKVDIQINTLEDVNLLKNLSVAELKAWLSKDNIVIQVIQATQNLPNLVLVMLAMAPDKLKIFTEKVVLCLKDSLIKDVRDISALLISFVDPERMTTVAKGIVGLMSHYIKTGYDFNHLIHHLDPSQRHIVFDLIKKHLVEVISTATGFDDAQKYLNEGDFTTLCAMMTEKLPLIKGVANEVKHILTWLPVGRGKIFLNSIKPILANMMATPADFGEVARMLSKEDVAQLFNKLKNTLAAATKTATSFAAVKQWLPHAQKKEWFQLNLNKMNDFIQSSNDVAVVLAYTTGTLRQHVFDCLKNRWDDVINTARDFSNVFICLGEDEQERFFKELFVFLPTLISQAEDIDIITWHLSKEQQAALLSQVKPKLLSFCDTARHFETVYAAADEKSQRYLLKKLKGQWKKRINTSQDFSFVMRAIEDSEDKQDVFLDVVGKLAGQLSSSFADIHHILKFSSEEVKTLYLTAIKQKLPQLIKRHQDFFMLIHLADSKAAHQLILDVLEDKLVDLIKDYEDLESILSKFDDHIDDMAPKLMPVLTHLEFDWIYFLECLKSFNQGNRDKIYIIMRDKLIPEIKEGGQVALLLKNIGKKAQKDLIARLGDTLYPMLNDAFIVAKICRTLSDEQIALLFSKKFDLLVKLVKTQADLNALLNSLPQDLSELLLKVLHQRLPSLINNAKDFRYIAQCPAPLQRQLFSAFKDKMRAWINDIDDLAAILSVISPLDDASFFLMCQDKITSLAKEKGGLARMLIGLPSRARQYLPLDEAALLAESIASVEDFITIYDVITKGRQSSFFAKGLEQLTMFISEDRQLERLIHILSNKQREKLLISLAKSNKELRLSWTQLINFAKLYGLSQPVLELLKQDKFEIFDDIADLNDLLSLFSFQHQRLIIDMVKDDIVALIQFDGVYNSYDLDAVPLTVEEREYIFDKKQPALNQVIESTAHFIHAMAFFPQSRLLPLCLALGERLENFLRDETVCLEVLTQLSSEDSHTLFSKHESVLLKHFRESVSYQDIYKTMPAVLKVRLFKQMKSTLLGDCHQFKDLYRLMMMTPYSLRDELITTLLPKIVQWLKSGAGNGVYLHALSDSHATLVYKALIKQDCVADIPHSHLYPILQKLPRQILHQYYREQGACLLQSIRVDKRIPPVVTLLPTSLRLHFYRQIKSDVKDMIRNIDDLMSLKSLLAQDAYVSYFKANKKTIVSMVSNAQDFKQLLSSLPTQLAKEVYQYFLPKLSTFAVEMASITDIFSVLNQAQRLEVYPKLKDKIIARLDVVYDFKEISEHLPPDCVIDLFTEVKDKLLPHMEFHILFCDVMEFMPSALRREVYLACKDSLLAQIVNAQSFHNVMAFLSATQKEEVYALTIDKVLASIDRFSDLNRVLEVLDSRQQDYIIEKVLPQLIKTQARDLDRYELMKLLQILSTSDANQLLHQIEPRLPFMLSQVKHVTQLGQRLAPRQQMRLYPCLKDTLTALMSDSLRTGLVLKSVCHALRAQLFESQCKRWLDFICDGEDLMYLLEPLNMQQRKILLDSLNVDIKRLCTDYSMYKKIYKLVPVSYRNEQMAPISLSLSRHGLWQNAHEPKKQQAEVISEADNTPQIK